MSDALLPRVGVLVPVIFSGWLLQEAVDVKLAVIGLAVTKDHVPGAVDEQST